MNQTGTAIAVLAVIVIASLSFNVYQYASPRTMTSTTTSTTTWVETNLVACDTSHAAIPLSTYLQVGYNSPAAICVRFYYYDPASNVTETVEPLNVIAIQGTDSTGETFEAGLNFSITASPASLNIGGATDMNEGAVVTYTIAAKQGVSGTYALNFGWLAPSILNCGQEFVLAVGNDSPSYLMTSGCITMQQGNPPQPYPPGVLPNGTVFAEPFFVIDGTS
jgi:hypothetical protein